MPHKDWSCDFVEDLGDLSNVCEWCGTQQIRYVHHMSHPSARDLAVGCVCAEKMEDDYVTPRLREARLRNQAARRRTWVARKWRVSAAGNLFLNVQGINVTVFARSDGTWGGRIEERTTGRFLKSRRIYPDASAAKLAAFDALVSLRDQGWGKTR